MPPVLLGVIAPGEVVEGRVYATWRNQEFITKFYWRAIIDGDGTQAADTQAVALKLQAAWRLSLAPLVPLSFAVRQYWASRVHSVVSVPTPKPHVLVSYVDQTIVLGDLDDIGSSIETELLPPATAATMNRFGSVRTKNWRSSIRMGPVARGDQNSGLLTDGAITNYNTALTASFIGLLAPATTWTVQLLNCLFSPKLAIGKTQTHMEDASQNIDEWRVSRLVGTQNTRKIRAAGY